MTINAGKLRHRIDILHQAAITQNPLTGAVTQQWAVLHAAVAAGFEPLSVREFMSAASLQSKIVARVTVRYREGLDGTMRVRHRGVEYQVEGWLPDPVSGLEYLTAPVSHVSAK